MNGIEVESLSFGYGKQRVLDDVSFTVREGGVVGLLGHNGAGKTSVVRILSTLIEAQSGCARVAGFDVGREPDRVRSRIALAGQYAAVDDLLTGRQNLELIGRLHHLGRKEARRRADRLIEEFDLTAAAGRPLRTYSGGMKRRLDLAACLVADPAVLFLDEPTTGLDPISRSSLWVRIRALVADGATVLLTTQYLEEAEQLADTIVVLNSGRVVKKGTPDELKRSIGLDRIVVETAAAVDIERAAALATEVTQTPAVIERERGRLVVESRRAMPDVSALATALMAQGIEVREIGLRAPTLDEVFVAVA